MFDKVLVANRGEIAVRVMRACEELDVETVAVYSDADQNAEHVHYADEAYRLGPARAADSYLDQDALLDVAERAGADAIHPGYGFLAENAGFAARVEETDGLTWVGPTSESMERLGGKTRARQVMQDADVPIVPGTTEPIETVEEIHDFGDEHGYPLAVKAEGGGGGRGLKVVREPGEAESQLEAAQREGEAYFDNDTVYLERYLDRPRHVEVQILADEHGNVLHLGERDCSLQRRHQKVIEEGPSPALSEGLRDAICEAARQGATAAGYTNAGTVEFLVAAEGDDDTLLDEDADFYFLEVNTRIQVEHCVTEELTGIDIVAWQLRIAAGDELDFDQDDVSLDGHAIEYRINAENAAEGFTPATGGSVERYDPPEGPGVRVDDGIRRGDELVTSYDSMVGKLIVHAGDRQTCLARSRRALDEFTIEGIPTILPFHRLMVTDDAFVAGTHTTRYLDDELSTDRLREAQQRWGGESEPTDVPDAYTSVECIVELDGKRYESTVYLDVDDLGDERRGRGASPNGVDRSVSTGGSRRTDTTRLSGTPAHSSSTTTHSSGTPTSSSGARSTAPSSGGRSTAGGKDSGTGFDTFSETGDATGDATRSKADTTADGSGEEVNAEMQGTVLEVVVDEGDVVDSGDVVCVLEAMKMENDIVAQRGGTVTSVPVEAGTTVDMGDTLVEME